MSVKTKRHIVKYFLDNENEWATEHEIGRTTKSMMHGSIVSWVNSIPLSMRQLAYITEFRGNGNGNGEYEYRLRPEAYDVLMGEKLSSGKDGGDL